MIYLGSYKHKRPGLHGVFGAGVRWLTKSQYSHSELCLGHPFDRPVVCVSASGVDGGVRSKVMQLKPEHWDVVPMPWVNEIQVAHFLSAEQGSGYDYAGIMRFVFPWAARASKRRWFCSEAVAHMAGLPEAWRFSPAELHIVAQYKNN